MQSKQETELQEYVVQHYIPKEKAKEDLVKATLLYVDKQIAKGKTIKAAARDLPVPYINIIKWRLNQRENKLEKGIKVQRYRAAPSKLPNTDGIQIIIKHPILGELPPVVGSKAVEIWHKLAEV
jgi:hypothetical protein